MTRNKKTKRHRIVKSLVRMTVLATGLFGIGSLFYSIMQEQYISRIEASRNIVAFRIATLVDREILLEPLGKALRQCSPKEATTCIDFLDLLIQTRNRVSDYKVFLVNTIGLKVTDSRIREIDDHAEKINSIPKAAFGTSLTDAAQAGIKSAEEYFASRVYIDSNSQASSIDSADIDRSISEVFEQSGIILRQIDRQSGSAVAHTQSTLMKWLTVIIAAEVAIFLMVNIADLMINNSSSQSEGEFTFSKIQPKVIPLIISVIFGFSLMVAGQILLIRQGTDVLIGQCREHNQQSISFMNRLEATVIDQDTLVNVSKLLELPMHCSPFVAQYPNLLIEISKSQALVNTDFLERLKPQLIGYADSFQLAQQWNSLADDACL